MMGRIQQVIPWAPAIASCGGGEGTGPTTPSVAIATLPPGTTTPTTAAVTTASRATTLGTWISVVHSDGEYRLSMGHELGGSGIALVIGKIP